VALISHAMHPILGYIKDSPHLELILWFKCEASLATSVRFPSYFPESEERTGSLPDAQTEFLGYSEGRNPFPQSLE